MSWSREDRQREREEERRREETRQQWREEDARFDREQEQLERERQRIGEDYIAKMERIARQQPSQTAQEDPMYQNQDTPLPSLNLMLAEFRQNSIAATRKYVGQRIHLEGMVQYVGSGRDMNGKPYGFVHFYDLPVLQGAGVSASFPNPNALVDLKPGDLFPFHGVVEYTSFGVSIRDCRREGEVSLGEALVGAGLAVAGGFLWAWLNRDNNPETGNKHS